MVVLPQDLSKSEDNGAAGECERFLTVRYTKENVSVFFAMLVGKEWRLVVVACTRLRVSGAKGSFECDRRVP